MWPNMARLLILVSLVYGLADDRPVLTALLSKSLVSCAVPTRLTELFDRNGTLASALAPAASATSLSLVEARGMDTKSTGTSPT